MDLVQQLAKAEKRKKINAFLLVAPLLLFIIIVFITPITTLLFKSVDNKIIPQTLPLTIASMQSWDFGQEPTEEMFAALAQDLIVSKKNTNTGKLARRINFEVSGARSMIKKLARKANKIKPPYKSAIIKINKKWGQQDIWRTIKSQSGDTTNFYYLAAFDLTKDDSGDIVMRPENKRIYIPLFIKTFTVSLIITLLCFIFGFPVAHLLATLPTKKSNLLLILVLLPFWTSLLVRTVSWIVLLQTQGVVNDILVALNLFDDSDRVRMIYNMTGTIVAMTHILLPFMILPLFSVMKNIPPNYMRAAQSLGSPWSLAFLRVYFPLTIPGISAGALLVFILSIGYYITPALVGGSSGQLISNLIAFHVNNSLNWGLGAALSGILLVSVLALYWLYNRLIGIDKLQF